MSSISQKVRAMCDCLHSFSMTRECQQSLALERTGHTRFAAPSQPPEQRERQDRGPSPIRAKTYGSVLGAMSRGRPT